MIKFRLSDKTKALLNDKRTYAKSAKPKGYYNSQEFYKRRPDLAPRNVYLAQGRVITKEQVDKYLAKAFKPTFKERCVNLFNKVKKIFKK